MAYFESLEVMRIRLANERRKRRYPFEEMNKNVPEGYSTVDSIDSKLRYPFEEMNKNVPEGYSTVKSDCIDITLNILKAQEPDSDNLFFRLAIIDYELGDLARAIVYSERFTKKAMFRDGFKDKSVILTEGKLAMADVLTQLHLLCISLGWNFEELRELGAQHLEERQKDFKRDEWKEVKS